MKNIFLLIDDNDIDLFIAAKIIGKVYPDAEVRKYIHPKLVIEEGNVLFKQSDQNKYILLVDIRMTEMNGFEFLDNLRTTLADSGISLPDSYLLSSSIDPADMDRIRSTGYIRGFIPKPLQTSHLKEIL